MGDDKRAQYVKNFREGKRAVQTFFEDDDYAEIKKAAEIVGMPIAVFVRSASLHRARTMDRTLKKLTDEEKVFFGLPTEET